ncbi:hypothetical protein [Streptomyces specialis]|uniref:hypothetical protein n=1 Tax=Streptomyces specialis TaxID=498367 RepID=UPI00073E5B1C|nr:hypothetical protein [Streptomyces specialis]
MRAAVSRAGAALLATAAAAAVAGCGIRATDVPVDAGPAPTRASCDMPSGETGEGNTEIYLVCGSRVQAVGREMNLPEDDSAAGRVAVAQALLDALRSEPAPQEQAAGLSTEIPIGLEVSAADDPVPALRLSLRPGDLSREGLAQIVCTFANNEVLGSSGDTVLLGGPAGSSPSQPRMYSCAAAMRTVTEPAESTVGPP